MGISYEIRFAKINLLGLVLLIMFYFGGIALAVFLNLLLLSKKGKSQADFILTAWLLLMTLHLFLFYLRKIGIQLFLGAEIPLPLVHGPILYLYTRALTNGKVSLKFIAFHLALPILVCVYLIPFFLLPIEQKIYIVEHNGVGYEAFNNFRFVANISSGVLYVIASTWVLRNHRQNILNEFSSTDKINLLWLQYLIFWIGGIWLLVIFTNDDWIFAATVLFLLFIGYFGIRQVGIFHSTIEAELETKSPSQENQSQEIEKPKYSKSGLTEETAEILHHDLLQLMADEKTYLNNELTLGELASKLNTQPNHLSQVINDREGKSFYDYINTLRIDEFKRLVANPESQKYTLLALAQQCGFNSKSSFNRYFKKVTGKSPTEFFDSAVSS